MLPIKMADDGVLIISLSADLAIDGRAAAVWAIDDLLSAHRPSSVILELTGAPVSPAAVSTVVRADRMCGDAGVRLAVVAPRAEARRALASGLGARTPEIHATVPAALGALADAVGLAA
ncbi:hypothetical protein SAVIM338S_00108 [Streptomyces avidinii]